MTQGTSMHEKEDPLNVQNHCNPGAKKNISSKSSWNMLSKMLLELDEKNYAQQSNVIVMELQSLLLAESESDRTNNIAVCVMYILYERALREFVTSGFPVSASISDALTGSSTDIYDIIQAVMRLHFQDLMKKLEKFSPLTCNDIGIMFLLLSIYRLNKLGGRDSELTEIFDMTIKNVLNYIESVSDFTDINLLMMLLYSLIAYSLDDSKLDDRTIILVNFIRKALIKHGDVISNFTKVLILDILERLQNNKPIQLYEAIYKKIFQPEIFIIPGLSKFINNVAYPAIGPKEHKDSVSIDQEITVSDERIQQQSTSTVDNNIDYGDRNLGQSTSNDSIDFNNETVGESVSVFDNHVDINEETAGESVSIVDNHVDINDKTVGESLFVDNHVSFNEKTLEESAYHADINEKTIGESTLIADGKSSPEIKPTLKWSISQMQQEPVVEEKITEILKVPENCIGRVVGFQGAIARKLELESNAVIEVCNPDEPPRPVTSCLTAHKLVTGCLGLPLQIPTEQVEEEKLKLSNAKVRRQTEERGEQMRAIKISGSEKEIYEAMKLIKDILTCVVTIHINLDFTVDEILETYSGKLKTIEMLLNIYLEVEELPNGKVVLNISGDEKSCQDAKKLIFEEVGSFRSQHGHLFFLPQEMMSVLKNKRGVNKIVETVQIITSARILCLSGAEGYAVFISGYQYQVNRSLQIFQKINADVMCCLSDTSDGDREDLNTEDICQYIKECFRRSNRGENKIRPTLLKKKIARDEKEGRLMYTKEKLLELSSSELARTFPENLVVLDDPAIQQIILYEGHTRPAELLKC